MVLRWVAARLWWKQPSLNLYNHTDVYCIITVHPLLLLPWALVCSVLKSSCWHESQVFCGSSHPGAYHHVDDFCMITASEQEHFSLFESWMLLFIWYTVADINFKIFVDANIMLKPHAWMTSSKEKKIV